ncbi:Tetrathionate reductase subunit B precursor [Polystyrenella longa]|uniref:Tetrathionate reductase subunit B n=1 Tax=Polystyrenella longa TaxID=2528007 RepID=A0A518CNK0_9PLAN|nr:TAT-variant-translocated molybdopterin oxidoreductase [Polystyrenella longa]QDU80805.1 Tetrathionate reductase subunit B precursor [Polystyrenella longa]
MSSVKETAKNQKYWRSLDQLEGTPEFEEFLHREFPQAASEFPENISRRRWLQLMGASFALAGMTGCRWEQETIAPFTSRPANRIPGKTQKFATMVNRGGYAHSLIVTSSDGRPIKVEGNIDHPASLGATTAFDQAEMLHLYDPDRRLTVTKIDGDKREEKSWGEALAALQDRLTGDGSGFAVLSECSTSLTQARLKQTLQEQYPNLAWYQHESLNRENEWKGAELAFGTPLRPQYDLTKADIVLSLDADLLGMHPNSVSNIRQWSSRRVPEKSEMNRWYVVESQFTTTGSTADHRQPLRASAIPGWLAKLEQGLSDSEAAVSLSDFDKAVIDDLTHHKGTSLVVAGPNMPPEVHAVVARINGLLENLGQTVTYTNEPLAGGGTLTELVSSIDSGNVSSLLILGGNPVYTAADDLQFASKLNNIAFTVHLSQYKDETSRLCTWHLPAAHSFESWGDGVSYNGVYTLQQPLIDPLHDGKSALEMLSILSGEGDKPARVLVGDTFRTLGSDNDSENAWRAAVHLGLSESGGLNAETAELQESAQSVKLDGLRPVEGLELTLVASSSLYDGRYANNGWLQETPDPLTKLTWDNVALISYATAEKLGVENYTFVTIRANGKKFDIPAYIMPGQPDDTISIELGYGRVAAGAVGGQIDEDLDPVGVNAGVLRTVGSMDLVRGVEIETTGRKAIMASTQDHHLIDKAGMEEISGRIGELVRGGTLSHYEDHPDFAQHMVHHPPLESLWEDVKPDSEPEHKWGMSIDLSRCIGCNACSVACQSENNVPVVGKDQVSKGREMHWLRIDRYFEGDIENPKVANQVVACQQCENAPCEQVCPVAATVHSDEGLNDMVYNRCIGTRYCGNNCPYKVRRFNFFNFNKQYEQPGHELVGMVLNPEVTVRHRGVMEKCTFCVQRIQNGKIDAKVTNSEIKDGDIMTACQQACPANAIEFGDLKQEDSLVSQAHNNPRSYAMLEELNVRPRNKFLARIRNPHPSLEEEVDHGHHDEHAHDEHEVHGDETAETVPVENEENQE